MESGQDSLRVGLAKTIPALVRCLCSAFIAVALFAFLLTLVSSPSTAGALLTGRIVEFQVSTSPQHDQNPDIDGSTVVWMNGNRIIEMDIHSDKRETIIRELESRNLDFEEVGNKAHIFHAKLDDSFKQIIGSEQALNYRPATLEDVFFRLTGRALIE